MRDQKQLPGFVCSPAAWIPPLLRHSPASGAAWGSQSLVPAQSRRQRGSDRSYNAERLSVVSQICWGTGAKQWTEPPGPSCHCSLEQPRVPTLWFAPWQCQTKPRPPEATARPAEPPHALQPRLWAHTTAGTCC